jgi:hypothetical protein
MDTMNTPHSGISFPPHKLTDLLPVKTRQRHERVLDDHFRATQTHSPATSAKALPRVDPTFINSPRGLALVRAYGVLDPPAMAALVLELFNGSILQFSSLRASQFPPGLRRVLSAGRSADVDALRGLVGELTRKSDCGVSLSHPQSQSRGVELSHLSQEVAQRSLCNVTSAVLDVIKGIHEQDPRCGVKVLVTKLYQTIRYDMPMCCTDVFFAAWYGVVKCVLESEFASVDLKDLARSYVIRLTTDKPWWWNEGWDGRNESWVMPTVVQALLDTC